ncbi:hypothetical protein BMF94_6806 [Rhodotorula taiwanensis]|uniref:Ubiquitin thioesterase OTU n=1 Tax=Rhodotorula taiwanensis TaxID=741276 RepID=A0A2S5B0B7_9BASI|nr:hypothetical protein BMF94_6806 [Rhodotorula taiwanensis]
MLNLRVRGPTGPANISLEQGSTVAQLRLKVQEATGIEASRQQFRGGFPPKPIAEGIRGDATLSSIGLASGEMLIVSEGPAASGGSGVAASQSAPPPPAATIPRKRSPSPVASTSTRPVPRAKSPPAARVAAPAGAPKYVETDGSFLVLRTVPDDNSCLFRAVGLVLASQDPDASASLRRVVADTIQGDADSYPEVVLGRPPAEYISTIRRPTSWGGAIELSILAKHFQTEIWSIDVQTGRVDRFGQDAGYETFVLLVYSGIHYDALTLSFVPPEPSPSFPPPNLEFDTTVFPRSDEHLLAAAQKLVGDLRKEHAYTDTATFALQCGVCRQALTGEKEARKHAEATGHTSFAEYEG